MKMFIERSNRDISTESHKTPQNGSRFTSFSWFDPFALSTGRLSSNSSKQFFDSSILLSLLHTISSLLEWMKNKTRISTFPFRDELTLPITRLSFYQGEQDILTPLLISTLTLSINMTRLLIWHVDYFVEMKYW
jgi:hypothetical protein